MELNKLLFHLCRIKLHISDSYWNSLECDTLLDRGIVNLMKNENFPKRIYTGSHGNLYSEMVIKRSESKIVY